MDQLRTRCVLYTNSLTYPHPASRSYLKHHSTCYPSSPSHCSRSRPSTRASGTTTSMATRRRSPSPSSSRTSRRSRRASSRRPPPPRPSHRRTWPWRPATSTVSRAASAPASFQRPRLRQELYQCRRPPPSPYPSPRLHRAPVSRRGRGPASSRSPAPLAPAPRRERAQGRLCLSGCRPTWSAAGRSSWRSIRISALRRRWLDLESGIWKCTVHPTLCGAACLGLMLCIFVCTYIFEVLSNEVLMHRIVQPPPPQ